MFKKKNFLIALFFLIIFIFLNFKLTQVPNGINGDEASIGYNAILVGDSLRDENHRFLPPFILTLNQKDWKQPVTFYSTVLAFKIFGPSFFALREVSVIYTLVSAILIFILLNRLKNFRFAIIGTLVFITTPIVIIQSHLALENIAPLPFVLLWLINLYQYQVKSDKKYLIFASLALFISFFTYNGMRLIVPVLILASIVYLIFLNKSKNLNNRLWELFYFLICFAPLLVIIPYVNTHYSGALLANNNPTLSSSYLNFFLGFLSNFDLSFLYITGDTTTYHSTSKAGMFLLSTLPFFFLGSYQIIKTKNSFWIFMLICFFVSPVLFGFTEITHRASRLLALVPFYVLVVSLGIESIINLKSHLKSWIIVFSLVLIALNFFDFIYDYWFFYPIRSKDAFWSNSHLAFPELKRQIESTGRKPAIQYDIYLKEDIAAKFFEKVYFPNNLTIWSLNQKLDDNFIVLGTANLTNLKEAQFQEYPIQNSLFSIYKK